MVRRGKKTHHPTETRLHHSVLFYLTLKLNIIINVMSISIVLIQHSDPPTGSGQALFANRVTRNNDDLFIKDRCDCVGIGAFLPLHPAFSSRPCYLVFTGLCFKSANVVTKTDCVG